MSSLCGWRTWTSGPRSPSCRLCSGESTTVFSATADRRRALARAIQERLRRLYGWAIGEPDIVFLPGIVTGLNIAFQAFAAPGEGILAQPPVYFHFLRDPVQHGRILQDPPLVQNGDSYEIDFDQFERAITDRNTRFCPLQSAQSGRPRFYASGIGKNRRDLPSPRLDHLFGRDSLRSRLSTAPSYSDCDAQSGGGRPNRHIDGSEQNLQYRRARLRICDH